MTNPLRWLSLIALERSELPDAATMTRFYGDQFPGDPPLTVSTTTAGLLTLEVGGYTAAATLVPQPIPWSQLEGPCATAWHWPEAADQLRGSPAHAMTTLVDEGGAATEKAAHLTRLTAALTAASSAAGVFWGPSRMVHEPNAFWEQAAQMKSGDWPLFLWIDFRIEHLQGADLRLFTTGLEALGAAEIEIPRYVGSPQHLLEHAYNFAHYQLDQQKEIADGDAIGLTDTLQATVRRTTSMFGGEMEVIQLDFDEPIS